MKHYIKNSMALAAFVFLALIGSAATSVSGQEIGQCLTDDQVNQAVATGQILPLPTVLSMAGLDYSANVLNASVCWVDRQQYFVVDILRTTGMTSRLILRASDGASYN